MKIHKPEVLEYEQLKGFDKAAILINYLGTDAVKVLLKHMDDADIRKLINQMNKLRIVPVHVTKRVLEEYYEMISETDEYIFSNQTSGKDTIVDALGEERARGILGGLNITAGNNRSLESLEMVDAKSLATFLVNEHPQTVDRQAQAVDVVALHEVQRDQGGRLAGRLLDLVVEGFQRALAASDGDHVSARLSQGQGALAADAARRAGDQGDAAVEGKGLSHDLALEADVGHSAAPGRRRP